LTLVLITAILVSPDLLQSIFKGVMQVLCHLYKLVLHAPGRLLFQF